MKRPSSPTRGPWKILVVDDEPTQWLLTRDCLEREGYRVAEAADGDSALAMMRAEPPAAVLLDLVMPDRDGLDLIRSLPAEGRPKVLAISGGSTMLPAAYTLRA